MQQFAPITTTSFWSSKATSNLWSMASAFGPNDGPNDEKLGLELNSSDEMAIEIAGAIADSYVNQLAQDYRDHKRRSQERRNAELRTFQEAEDRIRRRKRGWSALSDRELNAGSLEERRRARWARCKRDLRARKAKPTPPTSATAPREVTREEFTARLVALKSWLALPGHRQRHLRGREVDIFRAWVLLSDYIARNGRSPTRAAFASAFETRFGIRMSRSMAGNRLMLLAKLEAADGPWSDSTT